MLSTRPKTIYVGVWITPKEGHSNGNGTALLLGVRYQVLGLSGRLDYPWAVRLDDSRSIKKLGSNSLAFDINDKYKVKCWSINQEDFDIATDYNDIEFYYPIELKR